MFDPSIHHIHFVGITGVAMTALALYCQDKGIKITGSDKPGKFPTTYILKKREIAYDDSFDPSHIESHNIPDLVIYTGACGGKNNPEVIHAIKLGCPVMSHAQALGECMKEYRQICVSGCHGKTTTTSMVATILMKADLDPSYAIGSGMVAGLGYPGRFGKGNMFVAESDEYMTDPTNDKTPRFLWQSPTILVITNIDYDHPDAYKNLNDVKRAYEQLIKKVHPKGACIYNADDPNTRSILPDILTSTDIQAISIGWSQDAAYRIEETSDSHMFSLQTPNGQSPNLTLSVLGKHNIFNAAAASVASRLEGVSWDDIGKALIQFGGASRRFEYIGSIREASVYDDYAHHPTEIQATIATAKNLVKDNGGRLIAVFQPHTYTRTEALFDEFMDAFNGCDTLILTQIYASAREQHGQGDMTKRLYDGISKNVNAVYAETFEDAKKELLSIVKPHDVIVFMGAGDIYTWSRSFVSGAEKL